MNVKRTAAMQYRAIVNRVAESVPQLPSIPPEGWMATARKALGMPAAQLAARLGVTRARVYQAEQSELSGSVTLKTMQATAEAMGCRFVYAIVPPDGRVETLIAAQALVKARALVGRASTHMLLEDQGLPDDKNRSEIDRVAEELERVMPADFWKDD